MVYQISDSQQALPRPVWGGIRPAPAGWLTVGGGGALAGPRRVGPTVSAGHATPASAPTDAATNGCQVGDAATADLVCADPANGHTSAGSLATTAKSAITPAATTAALARSRRTQDAALQLAEGGAGQRRKCVDPFGALVARQ